MYPPNFYNILLINNSFPFYLFDIDYHFQYYFIMFFYISQYINYILLLICDNVTLRLILENVTFDNTLNYEKRIDYIVTKTT